MHSKAETRTPQPQGSGLNPDAPRADVCVIGLGYVGLPTAALLATHGHQVVGVDIDEAVVAKVAAGEVHIEEPELDALVSAAVARGRLSAQTEMPSCGVYVICVPTPLGDDRRADLRAVLAAGEAVAACAPEGALVVLESTSPPGTTRGVIGVALTRHGRVFGRDVFVAHAPERVLPGAAVHEVVHNDRVVGGLTPACTRRAVEFYRSVCRGRVEGTQAEVAEVTKLAENAFRDVNIAFANELDNICAHHEIPTRAVIALANRHPRVEILRPGPGVGGHCIAVDPWFLMQSVPADQTRVLPAARAVNDARPARVIRSVQDVTRPGDRVAVLGLTYKPDIDDLRESPALEVARGLAADETLDVHLCDPHLRVSPIASHELRDIDAALHEADVVVVLVAHACFRDLPRPACTLIDTVGLWHGRAA